jgi:hypothetical protein
MTDIEAKALALVNEVRGEYPNAPDYTASHIALCRTLEQHEAFKQEVSDALVEYFGPKHLDVILAGHRLNRFIIPKPKPDPLLGIVEWLGGPVWGTREEYVKEIHKALDARGLEIREKGK